MIKQDKLGHFLLQKYPKVHDINNDKMLREYVMTLKNTHLRKSSPLSKVIYDKKIHVVNNALGLHTFVSRVQGNKLKSKN
jgi:predicted metal-dependent hydrolase